MTEEVDRLKARMEELLELRNQTMVFDEVGVFGDCFDPWRHNFEAHRIIYAQIREQAEDSSKAEPTPQAAAEMAKELRDRYDGIFEAASNGGMPTPDEWSELVRGTEGAEPRGKGGRPKQGIAQLIDIALTMRACRELTRDAKSQKWSIGEIAKSFGVSPSTVYARTPALSAEQKEHSEQPAGEGSEKPTAARR
jgi:hypothetical protein